MSISSELLTLQNTKTAIRTAINNKGGSVGASDTFASYATAIDNLPSGGSGNPLMTSIDVSDFSGTTMSDGRSYITDVIIPSGVTTLNGTFNFFTNITSVNIPNTVTTIGNSTFNSCSALTSITIPSGVTSIGQNAFNSCSSLTSITIPSGVTSIGQNAFYNCSRLKYIICLATTPPTIGAAFNNTNNCPIYVPSASVDAYKAANNWSTYADRIYPIQQVATVDGNPVYNYDIGNKDATVISDTERSKIPTGDSIEFAEGVTQIGGQLGAYEEVILPSTFTDFNDTQPINAATTTLTSKATTPPSVERSNLGGSGLTAIYVPSASVDTYKAHAAWSGFASIIQAMPVTSITFVEKNGDSSPYNKGDFADCETNTQNVDFIPSPSGNSTFDFDIKTFGNVVVEDNYGNDVTSQCTFTSSDYYHWQASVNDPEFDPEYEEDYYMWMLDTQINPGDSEAPHSATITATYGNLTATFTINWTTTDNDCGGGD